MVLVNCLVVGGDEPFQHIFEVQASPDETVAKLRKRILEEDPKLHSRISAHDLRLYTPKQIISTYSEDIFNDAFARLNLDTPEGRLSALDKLNPTFTVEESGLSEPVKHQLHVLVAVPASRIIPSNLCNLRLSDILMGSLSVLRLSNNPHRLLTEEPPAKRLCVEGSVISDGPIEHIHSKVPLMMLDYHRQFRGSPLDPALTILPDQASTVSLPMLVRAEYIRVLDAVKATYQKSDNTSLAVVTGQPGIGKTSWISYALRYCLREKQPVVWYRFGNCYSFPGRVWPSSIPYITGAVGNTRELFPVYVTSPKESRWSKLPQSGRIPELIVMNPWTLDELEKAAQLYPDRKLEDIRERYHNAGPSARLCLTYNSAAIQEFYNSREQRMENATTVQSLKKLMFESASLTDEFSHEICVIRRSDHNSMDFYTVGPATDFVR
ncbi:hypothetical protein BU17DRAFT_102563 [Hysterangium stoloniferum]|nr:hypothetical protein BU17DRAFT_102563 [Hysterangium stoloniferum]